MELPDTSEGAALESRLTNAPFETMNWHDTYVHGLAFEPEEAYAGKLLLDVDYIARWIQPVEPGTPFTFILIPSTVVFDQSRDMTLAVDFQRSVYEVRLDGIDRSPHSAADGTQSSYFSRHAYGDGFDLKLLAVGFRLVPRDAPILSERQWLTKAERGGVRFAQSA